MNSIIQHIAIYVYIQLYKGNVVLVKQTGIPKIELGLASGSKIFTLASHYNGLETRPSCMPCYVFIYMVVPATSQQCHCTICWCLLLMPLF